MIVKICGIKDKETLMCCEKNNVNFFGLIFYKNSPRNISKADAEYLLKLSDLKGSNAINFGLVGKRGILSKIFHKPLKNQFYFLFYFVLIIIKRSSFQEIYTSQNKKILIFDHSGRSIKKNLKLKSPIKKIFIPRIYILNELFRSAFRIKQLSKYTTNYFDRLNLIYFIKTCFEINYCCKKYVIYKSIIKCKF